MVSVDEVVAILQLYNNGLMSKKTAITKIGFTEDVDAEIERLRKEGRS